MKKTVIVTNLIAALLGLHAAQAQVAFTGNYAQNFDGMGTSGTSAPSGWTVDSEAGSHATFAPPGSYTAGVNPNFTAGALTADPTLSAGAPTNQKGLIGYNFDASGVTGNAGDRALGSSPSGNAATILELNLTNSTGSAISSLSLSYDIDRFTTTVDTNGDSKTSPNYGVEEYPGYQLFYNLTPGNNSTWVNVSSLNPTIDAGATGPVSVLNSTGVTSISDATIGLNANWNSGSTLALAWFDDNAESPSPDQLIGLNNVDIAAAAPEPSSLTLCLAGASLAFLGFRLRHRVA